MSFPFPGLSIEDNSTPSEGGAVMPAPFVYYYKLFESVVLFVYCDRVYLYSGNSDWIII